MKTQQTLLQTRVPADVAVTFRTLARGEGLSEAAFLRRLVLKVAPGSPKPVAYTVPREYDFQSEVVAPGEAKSIYLVPLLRPEPGTGIPGYPETVIMRNDCVERDFKPDRLLVPADVAAHFRIRQMFVGVKMVLILNKEEGARAAIFAEGAPRPEIDWPTVRPGLSVAVVVQNVSKRSRAWKARLAGREVAE